jgi:chemotaxis response regulator CheB
MPKAAYEIGAVETELPIEKIAAHILSDCRVTARRAVRV